MIGFSSQRLLFACIVIFFPFNGCLCNVNKGQGLPFGMQGQSEIKTDELTYVPSSEEFWSQYVSRNRPVVFRGACKGSRAYSNWTEEYLIKNYGDLGIRLEGRQEGSPKMPDGKIGLAHDSIGNFLERYQTLDAYAITQLPMPMEKDVIIPSCLSCGTFKSRIQEIHLFLSAKGGQTLLHRDPYSSMHCVFNGSKDWTLVHPRQLDDLYMSDSSLSEWGGFSEIDVNSVDLERHPAAANIEISKVHMSKGDCIFMPGGYWHFVHVKGYMNSAVSIWFSRMQHYNDGPCVKTDNDVEPTADLFPIIWRYSGHGDLSQGHMDIFILKQAFEALADSSGYIPLRKFVNHFMVLSKESLAVSSMVEDLKSRKAKFLAFFNGTMDAVLQLFQVERLSVEDLKALTEIVHPNDVSNTHRFEYSHIPADDVRDMLQQCATHETTSFDEDCIKRHYVQELGGTELKAKEVSSYLEIEDFKHDTIDWILLDQIVFATRLYEHHDLPTKIEQAVAPYANSIFHDPETERRIFEFLVNQRLIPSHDEL